MQLLTYIQSNYTYFTVIGDVSLWWEAWVGGILSKDKENYMNSSYDRQSFLRNDFIDMI